MALRRATSRRLHRDRGADVQGFIIGVVAQLPPRPAVAIDTRAERLQGLIDDDDWPQEGLAPVLLAAIGRGCPGRGGRDETEKMLILSGANATPTATFGTAGSVVHMCVRVPASDRSLMPGAVRTLVVADLTRRVLEDLHSSQVLLTLLASGAGSPVLLGDLDALMIRPLAGVFDSVDAAAAGVGARVGLMVTAAEDESAGEFALAVGAAAGSEALDDLIQAGHDPLTLRCVLLSTHYGQQVPLTMQRIADAARLLHRWRQRVADWSTHISGQMPTDIIEAASRAFDRNLEVPAVLDLMRHVESDAAIAPGAKFETFVHLDRVLAFDLTRYLGSPHS
jgi:hypothetical protein